MHIVNLKSIIMFLCLITVSCLPGCATIFSGPHQNVSIKSTPDGVHYKIENLTISGPILISEGKTPSTVSLRRYDAHFLLTLSQQGYETLEIPITLYSYNGVTDLNLLFGGAIGSLIDSSSGAMFSLEPDEVDATLVLLPAQETEISKTDPSIKNLP